MDIEVGALVMVPVVRTTQGVAMTTQDTAAKKWDTTISLAPALAATGFLKQKKQNGCMGSAAAEVWVLLQQKKLPRKKLPRKKRRRTYYYYSARVIRQTVRSLAV